MSIVVPRKGLLTIDTNEAKQNAAMPQDGAFEGRDVQIVKSGTKIILPNDPREMTEDEAIQHLVRLKKESEIKINIFEEVDCFPLEGAWALGEVLKRLYGYTLTGEPMKFFGMEIPAATTVTLEVAHNKKTQVLWGDFMVPGIEGILTTGGTKKSGRLFFVLRGEIRKKDQPQIQIIANEVRKFIHENSLYKGKAIKITTVNRDGDWQLDLNEPPSFLDLSRVNEEELVFSDDVLSLIQTNLFTPIEKTEQCRKNQIPLKRAVLLEGPYGTGKTLTAFVTAKKSVENNWTFIYLDRAMALKDILVFARKYAPVAIFAEDIERVTSGERTVNLDDVLNNIDGLDSKGKEVMCIFTTNHVEKIEPAMLRAGRLDAVITVDPPDDKAVQKLIRIYSRDLISPKEKLDAAGKELAGQIPAFIREVVERAKLFAISRMNDGDALKLSGDDIRIAAIGMKKHFALVNRKKQMPLTSGEKLGLALNDIIQGCHYESEEDLILHKKDIGQNTIEMQ